MKKQLILYILGGTTSQMAGFYRGYVISKITGRELILDISSYSNGYHFPYALDYFNINYKKLDFCHEGFNAISPNILPENYLNDFNPKIIETNFDMTLDEIIEQVKKFDNYEIIHLTGEGCYFQKPEYYDEIREIFSKESIEKDKFGQKTMFLDAFKDEIEDKISVGVFVRRKEYVTLGWFEDYSHYKAGIDYFREQFPNAYFYIFSDDLEDVKKYLGNNKNFRYVKFIGGADAHIEALLALSYCDHSIVGKTGWGNTIALLCRKKNSQQLRFGDKNNSLNYTKYVLDDKDINNYILK